MERLRERNGEVICREIEGVGRFIFRIIEPFFTTLSGRDLERGSVKDDGVMGQLIYYRICYTLARFFIK